MSQDDEDDQAQRRAHFRLRYPEIERPRFWCGKVSYVVTELSESGMRLHLDDEGHHWGGPSELDGRLDLHCGHRVVSGEFLREANHEVVFQLQRGVDLRTMLEEQKYLVRKYPALFGREGD